MSREQWLDLLSSGEIEIEGRLPWSSNYSFLATVRCGAESLRAVYKPGKGERPLWDFGPDLYLHEVAAFELSSAFGFDLVPETVLRLDGPLEAGSLQRFVDADFEAHYFTLVEEREHWDRLELLAGFDLLCNNADRKSGHVLLDRAGHIWAIDNGLAFHEHDKLRTVIWDFAGRPVPGRVLEACRSILCDGPPERLGRLLTGAESHALVRRAESILAAKVLPEPGDDYRAYPWPLV